MKRDYSDGETTGVKFFTGIEIEKTPAYGLKTLFVTGIQPVEDIEELYQFYKCEHIYLGANHSFENTHEFIEFCGKVLETGLLVTVDFDVKYVEDVLNTLPCICEYNNCIPQVSVKIPYADQLGYNATIKIDDKDFKASNPGVWCHSLRELQTRDKFTSWQEYGDDKIIE